MRELTISIPTYDRPDFLLKTLESLAKQIYAWRADVCIFIADDHPSGKNLKIVEAIKKQYPLITIDYVSNIHNLGIDENIKNCILTPNSRFIWLLGEDDLIVEGAISNAMHIIKDHSPPFIFANYIYCDDQHRRFARNAVIEERDGIEVVQFDSFIANHVHLLGFIGGCIINRSAWVETPYEKFKGSFYTHVGGILESCRGRDIFVMHGLAVLNRAEDINTFTWSQSTFKVYFSFFDVLWASSVAQDVCLLERCIKSAQKLFSVFSLPWLVAKRADGVFNASVFQSMYWARDDIGRWWKLCAALIAIAPRTPLQILRRLHLKHRFSRVAI